MKISIVAISLLALVGNSLASHTATHTALPTPKNTQQAILTEHNKYRALHHVPALKWSDTLAATALKNAKTCLHRPYTSGGENLAAGSSNNPAYYVWEWYEEIKNWNFEKSSGKGTTGHFTQVVWESTKEVGCAWVTTCDKSQYSRFGRYRLVCEYSPPGNSKNLYAANVKKPKSTSVKAPPLRI